MLRCHARVSFLLLLGLLLFSLATAHAQQTNAPRLFEDAGAGPQSLQAQGANRLETLEAVPTTGSVRLVRLADRLSQQTLLRMQLDGRRGLAPEAPVAYRSKDAETNAFGGSDQVELFLRRDAVTVHSDDTYAWRGTVLAGSVTSDGDSGDNVVGNATLIYRRGGHVTGTIRIKDELYQVRPLSGGLHALVDIDESDYPQGNSPRQDGGGAHAGPPAAPAAPAVPAPQPTPQEKGCAAGATPGAGTDGTPAPAPQASAPASVSCGPPDQDVLVVYTSSAASGRDIDGLISLALQETNDAYNDSYIYGFNLELAHKQQVGFTEATTIGSDILHLINDNQIQSLRNQHEADLVILLTDGGSEYGAAGLAAEVHATASEAYAIVEAEYATGYRTFGHEVGHLQGAQHHPDDDTADPSGDPRLFSYGFGHRFSERDCNPFWPFCDRDYYATVMSYTDDSFRWIDNQHTRVSHFSNPDVEHDGVDTGTSSRDNERVLENTASEVAQFRGGVDLNASITVTKIKTGFYLFAADPCGGDGNYSYEWRVSYNGMGNFGGVVSTVQQYSNRFPPGTHFVKLTVTDGAGHVATDVITVYVPGNQPVYVSGDDCRQPPCQLEPLASTDAQAAGAAVLPETFALRAPYPNPFSSSTEMAFDLPERAEVYLAAYDMLGREVAVLVNEPRSAGVYRARLEATGLASGVYVVRLSAGTHTQTQQVVLVK